MADGNGFTNKEILLRLEEKVDKILGDHESRIRGLERWRWSLPLSISSIGAFTAALAAVLLR